jgi:type IV secretory pathway TrbD component
VPGLALKPNPPHRSTRRGIYQGGNMKTLETVFAVLSWIIFAIVIWAVAPFLMKLMQMADHLHSLFK